MLTQANVQYILKENNFKQYDTYMISSNQL